MTFYWEGTPYQARAGDTIAAALLAAGISTTRETLTSGAPRAPFCMMGTCFECRVKVNGESNVQGCMRLVEEGMKIQRQRN
ncbi:(2Fe-2S)-binding protein [Vibrio aerogenes]|nr:(2Fe-2S)-binding protein [Vibrio aerogenes]